MIGKNQKGKSKGLCMKIVYVRYQCNNVLYIS